MTKLHANRRLLGLATAGLTAAGMLLVATPADAAGFSGYKTCSPAGRAVRVTSYATGTSVNHYFRGGLIGSFNNGTNPQTRNAYGTSSGGSDFWQATTNDAMYSASATCAST